MARTYSKHIYSRSFPSPVGREGPDVIQFLLLNAKPKGCQGCFVYHTHHKFCKKKKVKKYIRPASKSVNPEIISNSWREEKDDIIKDQVDLSVKVPHIQGSLVSDMGFLKKQFNNMALLILLMLATTISLVASLVNSLISQLSTKWETFRSKKRNLLKLLLLKQLQKET